MTAQTAGRNAPRRNALLVSDPLAAAITLYAGAMYALNASGYAVPAGTSGAGPARAVAHETVDNAAGAAGDLNVAGERGCFRFVNSAGVDEIAREDIGAQAYVVDDQTVALTSAGGSRQRAGRIIDVDSAGVWVDVGEALTESGIETTFVELTAAEMLALFATPIELIAAPGAGLATVLVDYQVHKPAGAAYAGVAAGEDISLKYTDASGAEIAQIEATGFLDQATAQSRYGYPSTSAAHTPVANAAVVAHMLIGEVTTCDSVVRFKLRHRTIQLAFTA